MNTPAPPATAAPPLSRPATQMALFLAFTRLALQGFGGVLAVAQRELVERLRWVEKEEFVELLAIAQVLPGPNIVNLSLMLGDRFFGLRGAFVALAGMLVAPSVLVLGLAALYGEYANHPRVVDALRGMGMVSAGLVIATGIKLMPALKKNPVGLRASLLLAGLCIALVVGLRLPLPPVLLGLGGLGMALAWRRLK